MDRPPFALSAAIPLTRVCASSALPALLSSNSIWLKDQTASTIGSASRSIPKCCSVNCNALLLTSRKRKNYRTKPQGMLSACLKRGKRPACPTVLSAPSWARDSSRDSSVVSPSGSVVLPSLVRYPTCNGKNCPVEFALGAGRDKVPRQWRNENCTNFPP